MTEYKPCDKCSGGKIFEPVPGTQLVMVKDCPTCRGTWRVPVETDGAPEPTEADRRRREFFKGENT